MGGRFGVCVALMAGLSIGACRDSGDPNADGGGTAGETGDDDGVGSTSSDPGTTGGSGDGTDSTGALPPKYDVGGIPDAPGYVCDGEGGPGGSQVEFSYIWIANSSQNTISKINTVSMDEEGRYQAKPSGGDPSRTSVSLSGNVAVANRNGGVAKFYANAADCVDSNGTPGIQTSSGGNDVLGWDEEECRAWYTDFTCSSNRPVAWTRGDWNEGDCAFENEKLWTACDDLAIQIDGDTGEVEHAIKLDPENPQSYHFIYGGAADADGNFWALDTGFGQLYRVDGEEFTVTSYSLPSIGGYGITVDGVGRPWVCGGGAAARFNLDDSTWTNSAAGFGGIGGCMTDGEDRIWHTNSSQSGVVAFDTETLEIVEDISLPEYVHGISIDFQGNVWGVSFAGSNAYRADPITDTVDTFTGLVGAYTYSDMTGVGLSAAGGGGTPAG